MNSHNEVTSYATLSLRLQRHKIPQLPTRFEEILKLMIWFQYLLHRTQRTVLRGIPRHYQQLS